MEATAMRIKWKLFLPTWLVIFLLAPSIFFPQAFLMTRSSPDAPGLPLLMPFGAIHWANELAEQMTLTSKSAVWRKEAI